MKKLIFVLAVLATLLVVGCETKYYTVLVTNDSSKTVSYTYNNTSDTLAAKTSKTYEVKAYTQPPKDISVPGALSVKITSKGGDTFTFVDIEPYNLNVVNKLPIEVKIKADNYIDDNGSTKLVIDANTEKTTAKIYTSNPNFTALTDYPVIIDWNYKNDAINVILR